MARKTILIFILIQTIAAALTWASSDPPLKALPENGQYKYYIGASDNRKAFGEAMNEAYMDALRENFGFDKSVTADSYATETNSQMLKRFRQRSKDVMIKDFERLDYRKEMVDGRSSISPPAPTLIISTT